MSNRFESILTNTIKPYQGSNVRIESSLIPVEDYVSNLGSNDKRFNTLYCSNIVQTGNVLEDSDVIWFKWGNSNLAIPLRFRFVNKSLGMISFEQTDVNLSPPVGFS
jgi:hypothetical protein